jgi:beta-glucosidase
LADRRNASTPGDLRLGGDEIQDSDKLLEQAVDLAKDADGVIAIVGLNDEWEAGGYDRTTLALPGRTDELIARVAAVNAKTIVVTQAVCVVLSLKDIVFPEEFKLILDRALR